MTAELPHPIGAGPLGVHAAPPAELTGAPPRRVPNVVPVKGLPIVAVVLAGLVVVIARDSFWGLVFYHVVGGALWTSIDLFVGLVVGPIIGSMSIPSRAEFTAKFMPAMVIIMPTVVGMSLGSGFQLARNLGNLEAASPNHDWVVASFIVVGIMAVIALGFLEPANIAVLFEMRKPQPDGEVIGKLMKRFVYTAGITGMMQIATLVIMTRIRTN
jgi:hypothetical protein